MIDPRVSQDSEIRSGTNDDQTSVWVALAIFAILSLLGLLFLDALRLIFVPLTVGFATSAVIVFNKNKARLSSVAKQAVADTPITAAAYTVKAARKTGSALAKVKEKILKKADEI